MSAKRIDDLYRHAKKRAAERYSLHLTFQEYTQFGNLIRQQQGKKKATNEVTFLWKESNNKVHYMIHGTYLVVYDKQRGGIATFLPPDAIHNYLPLVNGVPQIEYDRRRANNPQDY